MLCHDLHLACLAPQQDESECLRRAVVHLDSAFLELCLGPPLEVVEERQVSVEQRRLKMVEELCQLL